MVVRAKIAVLPGSPDTPESVEIACSGLDRGRSIEFLVDNAVVATYVVAEDGTVSESYTVPDGKKVALTNLGQTGIEVGEVPDRGLLKLSDETHSMALRYLV